MDMPKLEPFDMAACVADTLQESVIPPEIASQIDVTQATQTQVIGDQEQIKLVLSNLVRNACEAMSGGGRLIVRMISEAKMVRTEVEDNGVGIEAEQLPNVMEPLYTTRARGLGLGLAISKAVVDRHQGEILVTSTLGKGSIFSVRLPAVS